MSLLFCWSANMKCCPKKKRGRLGVSQSADVWYIQLGAGQINDIESELRVTIDTLLEHNSEAIIVLGESLLGKRVEFTHERENPARLSKRNLLQRI